MRDALEHAAGWLALGVAFEICSCVSYVLMFRPVFCRSMPWRTSWEIGWSELAMGSIVPASGAGGLALGAWILHAGGMPAERIARRSVAFFLIKSSVNFVAVAVIGAADGARRRRPGPSLWLTAAARGAVARASSRWCSRSRASGPGADRPRRTPARLRRAVGRGAHARSSTAPARRSRSCARGDLP